MSEIDHEFTDEIVCPHCGTAFYEDEEPLSQYTCGDCDKPFRCDAADEVAKELRSHRRSNTFVSPKDAEDHVNKLRGGA